MSPFGAVITSHGWLSWPGPLPGTPASPSRSRTSPSGLNLITWCPLVPASFPAKSVAQTLPSLSTWKPCGVTNSPAPEARQHFTGVLVELEDRIELRVGLAPAVQTAAAAVIGPDMPVWTDVDARGRTPHPAVGQWRPVEHHRRVGIGQGPLNEVARERRSRRIRFHGCGHVPFWSRGSAPAARHHDNQGQRPERQPAMLHRDRSIITHAAPLSSGFAETES